jgi:hypothetical protein
VAARRLFQRGNRLLPARLSEQSLGQDRHSGGIGPGRSQHFRGKLLGLGELLHPQRKGGPFKQRGVRMDMTARYVWHWMNFDKDRSSTAISMASGAKKHPINRTGNCRGPSLRTSMMLQSPDGCGAIEGIAQSLISDVKTDIEAERVGDCTQ